MSETQRKDSSEKQAWEHIAPELPPTGAIEGSGENLRGRLCGNIVATGSSREWLADILWDRWGITRKRYAELIAPQRVREAAEAKWPEDFHRIEMEHGYDGASFRAYTHMQDQVGCTEHGPWFGPDTCTAAWAAIQALGGGE